MRRTRLILWSVFVTAGLVSSALPVLADHSFDDVPADDVFHADVEALGASGITRGCDVRRFCPDDPVTRGQMAAFLRRALEGRIDVGSPRTFVDDDTSEFEADIEWLAAAGVTRGCDPPANTRFCPDDAVTRAQMAAFLRRALEGLVEIGDPVQFVDDDGSVFEADIEWLAATGITVGCETDRFCPDDRVTREQMAAFLVRALDLPANPLLAGRLEGRYDVTITVIDSDAIESPGDTYQDSAVFDPLCESGPCDALEAFIDTVYEFAPGPGTYSAPFSYLDDCVDEITGATVVADGYEVTEFDTLWPTEVDGDGLAAAFGGRRDLEYRATPPARAAGCRAEGSGTYELSGSLAAGTSPGIVSGRRTLFGTTG